VNFDLKVTLSSTFADNDMIGLVIAFVEDQNDLIPNNAFGLDPATHLGINVTDELIPRQYTISLLRTRGDAVLSISGGQVRYAIVYNYGKPSQRVLAQGSSLPWQTNLNWLSNSVDVRVAREGDMIRAYTTDFSDAPGGKGELRFELTFDLTSDPDTQKFRGPCRYGYSALSQENATFSNVEISGSGINEIYDLRNGDVWIAEDDQVLGYLVITWGWGIESGGKEALIDEIFISPPLRGQGLATALIQAALGRARDLGTKAVFLETERENPQSRKLYERLGFRTESSLWMRALLETDD
jgi:ribosomal protein S18 acetylase RimI-like enzyme